MSDALLTEVLDAGKAIGLLGPDGGLEADWFKDPLSKLESILSNSNQRAAFLDLLDQIVPPANIQGIDPQLATLDEFRRGKKSRVYAEVMNRGPADATNVVVRAFSAAKTGGTYPALPGDFWTKFPNSDPDLTTWQKFGDKITLGTLSPAQPKVAMWEFEMPSGSGDPVGVLVVATSTEDPVSTAELNANTLATNDRHAALREASVNMSAAEIVATILVVVGVATLVGVGIATAV